MTEQKKLSETLNGVPGAAEPVPPPVVGGGPPASGGPPAGGTQLEVSPDRLRRLAGPARELATDVRVSAAKMRPYTTAAVAALRDGWATSAALGRLANDWSSRLDGLAGRIGGVGQKISEAAATYSEAEDYSRRVIEGNKTAIRRP